MRPLFRMICAAAAVALLPGAAPAQRAAPPPGWKVIETADACAVDSGPFAVVRMREPGGITQGLIVAVDHWRVLEGEGEILMRTPNADQIITRMRQTAPGEYYIMLHGNADPWFQHLGNHGWFELWSSPKFWIGQRHTVRYSRDHMRQALAWLRGCSF